jgi:hypothetical protein
MRFVVGFLDMGMFFFEDFGNLGIYGSCRPVLSALPCWGESVCSVAQVHFLCLYYN